MGQKRAGYGNVAEACGSDTLGARRRRKPAPRSSREARRRSSNGSSRRGSLPSKRPPDPDRAAAAYCLSRVLVERKYCSLPAAWADAHEPIGRKIPWAERNRDDAEIDDCGADACGGDFALIGGNRARRRAGTKTAGQATAEAGAASRNVPRRSREAQGRAQSASLGAAQLSSKRPATVCGAS